MSFRNLQRVMQAALAAAVCVLPAWAAAAEAAAPSVNAESAVWTPKELEFVYQGFTSHYSCDGLLDKMRRVLLELGARSDLDVGPYGCTAPIGRPDPFPGVRIRMNVLKPAAAAGGKTEEATVPAQWQPVAVRLNRDPVYEAGDCELIEQIQRKILPLFTTRNVDYNSNCIPHQLSTGGTWLRAEVLITDQKGDKPLASK